VVLPLEYWNHFCMVWLRAHVEVPAEVGKQRTMKWRPNFDRPPPPLWRPGAPIGFAQARAWLQKRQLAATIDNPQGTGQDPKGKAHGQINVHQPAAPIHLRLRGKQTVVLPPVAFPVPKPRAAARPVKPNPDELTNEESELVHGLAGAAKNQMLKLIWHNREAVQNFKHFIVQGHLANTNGQLCCRDCERKGKWDEWKFFAKIAKCKRNLGGESLVRANMAEKAAVHNRTAAADGKHIVELHPEQDRFRCTVCDRLQPQSVKHYLFLGSACRPAARR